MKFRMSMKDPDSLHDAIKLAAENEVAELEGIDDEERKDLVESRRAKAKEVCRTWFRYGEYLTVEIDTEAKTCVVVKEKP